LLNQNIQKDKNQFMTNTKLPIGTRIVYNFSKLGIYGELGQGANAKIRFLETVITKDELDNITLISQIPGSETWEVRDLFQRDVDDNRVTNQILPYLKNDTLVKYFNPITLILLPMSDSGKEVLKEIEFISPEISEDSQIKEVYEKKNYYKFSIFDNDEPLAKIEWNNQKCVLVAIDGQHRISALKRWKSEPNNKFEDWKIPVIILNIFKVNKLDDTANILEVVRKTFRYINTKSEEVNTARDILLNDESVNAICAQELIQFAHENDTKPILSRDRSILPLIFFDWQGRVSNGKQVDFGASIKSIEEIYKWFEEYILDEDGKEKQRNELGLTDLIPQLQSYGRELPLTHDDALRVREQFRGSLLPGILYLLQNFIPYDQFISQARDIEDSAVTRSDLAQHAFMKLRFGSHNAPSDQVTAVELEFENLKVQFKNLKDNFPKIILLNDVGMRAVVYSYGSCRTELNSYLSNTKPWLEYSIEFTNAINEIYEEGWFQNSLDPQKKVFLINLLYDEADVIINYKIEQAKDAFGAFLVILVFRKFLNFSIITNNDFENIWGDYSSILRKTYAMGRRKFYKSQLSATWQGNVPDLNAEIRRRAEVDANSRVEDFKIFLLNL
jgi:hypothetical protein